MGETYRTPKGKLVFPYLNEPRQYKGQGKAAYDTDFDIEGEAGRQFEAFLEEYARAYAKRVGKRSISLESILKPATVGKGDKKEELDGVVRVHFKIANVETQRGVWDRKPAFYHPDGSPFEEEPQLGGGTLAQIAFSIYEWEAGPNRGMSLQPEGLMIYEVVERKGPARRDFGSLFGEASGGKATSAGSTASRDGAPAGSDF